MSLLIVKSPEFHADVTHQFRWYQGEGGEALAWRFFDSVDMTILKLSERPDIGRRRRFRHALLRDLWSCQIQSPFRRLLIFYRVTGDTLQVWRLMHGARDLPRRLAEPAKMD